MDRWFDAVEQAAPEGVSISFVFVVPYGDETTPIIKNRSPDALIIETGEDPTYERNWYNTDRYKEMVQVRNILLRAVRRMQPDFFLSVDSDILLHKDAITDMINVARESKVDAVCGPVFLDQMDRRFTNAAVMKARGGFTRVKHGSRAMVDVIMALKLMDIGAYNIDYSFSPFGEDFGWSADVKKSGLSMVYCGDKQPNKHVMKKEWLDVVDKRCGY